MAKVTDNTEIIAKLEEEFKYVNDNIKKLKSSLEMGEKFLKKVGEEQMELLCEQYEAMVSYRNVLAIRIQLLRTV